MKVFYFSNHIGDIDFSLLVKNVKRKPNPAGQNFHGRLIASLALNHEVTCFSLVPSAEEGFKRKPGIKGDGIPHYYFYPSKRPILPNAFTIPNKIVRTFQNKFPSLKGEEFIVIYDTLNIALARSAKIIAKKYGAKKIAVCTDDPYNISEVGETYISSVLHYSKDADGYFCLTKGLDQLFNTKGKPTRIHLGIAEEISNLPEINVDKPYIYYGGALFYKDGTPALVNAFLEAKPNCKLVISGHGPEAHNVKIVAEENEDVIFLGQISKEENIAYEKNALLCINPRLYRGYLDKVSVPSKVIEFLTYCDHVASTLSTPITEKYGDSIMWIPSDPPKAKEDLIDFFKSHMDEQGNLVNLTKNPYKEKILEDIGIKATGDVLSSLIEEITK
ncbi:MAG: hypothetical protein II721_06150 [Bacilli bacterium]|nr:hypothetical protein [Bacilli bacterium]